VLNIFGKAVPFVQRLLPLKDLSGNTGQFTAPAP
jgi:hypothetical protein